MSINSTPEKAPYPVAAYLKPSSEERSASQLVGCDEATNLPCSIPVNVGLFFDGTNNHMGRDLKVTCLISSDHSFLENGLRFGG